MTKSPRRSRRDALRLIAVSSAAVVAGCGTSESGDEGDGTGPEDGEDAETPTEDEGTREGDNETEQEDDGGEAEDGSDEDEGGNGEDRGAEDEEPSGDNETEEGEAGGEAEDGADDEWAEVDEIVLDGFTAGWEGVEPAAIEGEENPTLVLTEGAEYDLVWENADGQPHNIAIWDDEEEAIDDYETEIIEEEGETQTLTIEATSNMTDYVCVVHAGTMRGDIEVQPANTE